MAGRRQRLFRRAYQAVIALAVFSILICAGMVVTAAMEDARLSKSKGTATAEVLEVTKLRTSVRYRDAEGNYRQPDSGLRYPVGLVEGQQVRIEYQTNRPENMRVVGRTWTLAFRPALSSMAAMLAICGLCAATVRAVERRQRMTSDDG